METNGFYTQVSQSRLEAALEHYRIVCSSDALQQHFWALVTKCTTLTGIFITKVPAPPSLHQKRLSEDDGDKRILYTGVPK